MLLEYYESGNAPHEALGRAARKLSQGGAIYLGGGVGVEKQQTPKGEQFHVSTGAGKPESFSGPLSAVIRAFTVAGSSLLPDSPGGATAISDPAVAARLRELLDEEASTRRDLDRMKARVARRQNSPVSVYSPGVAVDDQWDVRRVEELKSDLTRLAAERTRLISTGNVEEVEQTRPGTNFTKIPPANVAKLKGIIEHYKGMAHPFTACVRDQIKHGLSEDHANRRCAVVKDLAMGTTKWRKGSKAQEMIAQAAGRLDVCIEELGLLATVQLAQDGDGHLAEGIAADFGLLSLIEEPLSLAVFGLLEGFQDKEHPRDFLGRFKAKLGSLEVGKSASVPGGISVTRREEGFEIKGGAGLGHHRVGSEMHIGRPAATEKLSSPNSAAMLAVTRSLRSRDPQSFGGAHHYTSFEDYESVKGKPKAISSPVDAKRKAEANDPASVKGRLTDIPRGQTHSVGGVAVKRTGARSWQVGEDPRSLGVTAAGVAVTARRGAKPPEKPSSPEPWRKGAGTPVLSQSELAQAQREATRISLNPKSTTAEYLAAKKRVDELMKAEKDRRAKVNESVAGRLSAILDERA